MELPNPSMSFSPFAILTAEELNDLVENIEALADGTGLDDGAVTPEKRSGGFYMVNQSFSSSGTGSVSITGVPFRPKGIMVFLRPQGTAGVAPWQFSATDGTTFANTGIASGISSDRNGSTTSHFIYTINSANDAQLVATLTSINDDGITLDITTNTGVATYTTFTFIFYG